MCLAQVHRSSWFKMLVCEVRAIIYVIFIISAMLVLDDIIAVSQEM